MKTKEFLSLLNESGNKELVFDYNKGAIVGANYHLTEVKNIIVDSVDCGAGTDFWKETIVQLWESPDELDKTRYMTVSKALQILNRVNGIRPMELEAELKIEYGNANFHTAQLFIEGHQILEDRLLIKLAVEKTDCKAKEECSVPVEINAEKEACCSPGGGCC
ncbi:DUF6428 family protein [Eudoraea sp.]|uniref:DUF6428 family protein n=1 Tax=Eudoraea sp. TaxID=1979955 RepID=UPI003C776A09